MDQIIFTGQPERIEACLRSIALAMNEIRACLLELEHNRKVIEDVRAGGGGNLKK